jgi:hypothetical protein
MAAHISLEAFEDVITSDGDELQFVNDCLSLEVFRFIEDYTSGRMWLSIRHIVGDKSDYGFSVYLDGAFGRRDAPTGLVSPPKFPHYACASPRGIGFDELFVLANDVQLMQSAEAIVSARSLIRFDRFNYRPIIHGEPPFVFFGVKPPFLTEEIGLGSKEGEVGLIIRYYAHRTSAESRRIVETGSHRIDDRSGFCEDDGIKRLAFAIQQAIARTINIELFDSGVRASFEPDFDSAIQDWQLGYGPINTSLRV